MIRGGAVVVYRDDRDALQARAEALEIELQDAKEEIERLRKKNTQMMSVLRMIAESRQQKEALERAGVTFDKGVPRIRSEPPPKPHAEVGTPSVPPPPRAPEIARASEAPPKLFERAGMIASKIPSVAPPASAPRPASVAPPSVAPPRVAPPSVAPPGVAPPSASPSRAPPSAMPRPIAMPMDPAASARASEPPRASPAPSVAPPKAVELESYYPGGDRASSAPRPQASERPPSHDGPTTGTNTIVRVDGDEHVPLTESTRPPRDPRPPGVYRINQPPPPRAAARPKRRRKSRPR